MKKVNIRLSLCARCLKDAKCYLAYMNEDKFCYNPFRYKSLIDYLLMMNDSGDTILIDTICWRTSIMGASYWSDKYGDVASHYRKYMIHVKNERIHNTKRTRRRVHAIPKA